jgi:hypothetical protein
MEKSLSWMLAGPWTSFDPWFLIFRFFIACSFVAGWTIEETRSQQDSKDATGSQSNSPLPSAPASPHPWLKSVPPYYSRLVDLGQVSIQVDEKSVRAANRTALTAFQFVIRYRARYRYNEIDSSSKVGQEMLIRARYTNLNIDLQHRILLSENYRPSSPWESSLLQHEFDHVAISTDPRLLAMVESLGQGEISWKATKPATDRLNSRWVQQRMEDRASTFQKGIEAIVNEYYRRLDLESANGQRMISDRSRFFRGLFQPSDVNQFLEIETKRAIIATEKIEEATVLQHYRLSS